MPDVSAAAAQAFRECVARLQEAGLPAEFWWRDDDLVGKSEKFRRLGQLSQQTGIVPLVSVIPAQADAGLGDLVRQFPQIVFCQHGYGHANHEPPDAPKSEFGAGRGRAAVQADIAAGRERMDAIFGHDHAAVFVAPWNRFPPEYAAILVDERFCGYSGYRGEASVESGGKLRCADVDIDVLNWGDPPSVLDPETIVARLTDILGSAEPGRSRPIGILTHHRAIDGAFMVVDRGGVCADRIDARRAMVRSSPTVRRRGPLRVVILPPVATRCASPARRGDAPQSIAPDRDFAGPAPAAVDASRPAQ